MSAPAPASIHGAAAAPPRLWSLVPDASGKAHIQLNLHPGQSAAWRSDRRFVWMLAGTQGGKTSFGPHWLYREMLTRGAGDYMAVTASYSLLKLKMLPEFLGLFHSTLHLGRWHASDKTYLIDARVPGIGGSRVVFGSAQSPGSLESATAKAAWLDECGQSDFGLDAWQAIQRRLSLHQGRVLGGTTIYNLGWLKQEAYDPWRAGDPDHAIVQFASITNPVFPNAEFERMRGKLPGWLFAMFYEGLFARPAGLIYGDFVDEDVAAGGHLVPDGVVQPWWPRYLGVDFGGANTAVVWLARDPASRAFYAYRESLSGGLSTPEHVRQVLDASAGEPIAGVWGGAASETQNRMDWKRAGLVVRQPPAGEVEVGVARVIGQFKQSRLFVCRSLKRLRDELGTYSRKVDPNGVPLNEIRDKRQYHELDALRYVVLGATEPAGTVLAQARSTPRQPGR